MHVRKFLRFDMTSVMTDSRLSRTEVAESLGVFIRLRRSAAAESGDGGGVMASPSENVTFFGLQEPSCLMCSSSSSLPPTCIVVNDDVDLQTSVGLYFPLVANYCLESNCSSRYTLYIAVL